MGQKRRRVPQDDIELDQLVNDVMDETQMFNKELTLAMVCQSIINVPRDEDHIAVSYLAAIVRKEISRALCKDRLITLNQNMAEINKAILEKNWIIQFNNDPNDMQARDELQRLADAGSEKAKQCLGDAYVQPVKSPAEVTLSEITTSSSHAN